MFVLGGPTMGFSGMTAPEIVLEFEEIKQLNSMWTRRTYSGGAASPITLQRGVSFGDDSFYTWVRDAQRGFNVPNKNLLAVHNSNIGLVGDTGQIGGVLSPVGEILRVPGRVWMLWNCLPSRYKAGGDFDATSGAVSIMELEFTPDAVEEFSLDLALLGLGAAGAVSL